MFMYIYICTCICTCVCICTYVYTVLGSGATWGFPFAVKASEGPSTVSFYTILPCTILYGVWRENGRSEGVLILRNSIAIVLQPCG